jgi:hypothetical protein
MGLSDNALLCLCPVLGLAANVAVFLLLSMLRSTGSPLRRWLMSTAVAVVVVFACSQVALERMGSHGAEWLAANTLNLVTGCALSANFLAFIGLNLTSLRIQLLAEILHAGGRLSKEELNRRYDEKCIARNRQERLLAAGHLQQRDGRLVVGRQFLPRVAAVVDRLRHIVFAGSRRS